MPSNELMDERWMATLDNPEDRFECGKLLETIEGISGVIVGLNTIYFYWPKKKYDLLRIVARHYKKEEIYFLLSMKRTGDWYAKRRKP